MEQDTNSYFISGILFLMTALIFFIFGGLGNKTGDWMAGALFALTAVISFYQYNNQKRKQENE